MAKYIGRLAAPLALGCALFLGACKSDASKQDTSALGKDSALTKDLAMAGGDTTAQPQLKDVPAAEKAAPKPAASRPSRPRAEEPAKPKTTPSGNVVSHPSGGKEGGGAVGSIAAGTTLTLTPTTTICTNTNKVGDKFTATVQNPVTGTNGATIPAGAEVTLTVTNLKRSENANDAVVMEFAVNSVTVGGKTYALDANVQSATVDKVRDEPKSKDVQKVAVGAAVGAIAGKILGKSTKATVIGGAVGAAGGAAAAVATANYQGCVRNTGNIVIKLNGPVEVRV